MKRLLLVGLLGYAIGLLTAPKKGADLRAGLAKALADIKGEGNCFPGTAAAQSKGLELVDQASGMMKLAKEKAVNLKDQGTEMAHQVSDTLNETKAKLGQNFDDAKDRANETLSDVKQTVDNAKKRANETVNEVKETASSGFSHLKKQASKMSDDFSPAIDQDGAS